jgi:chromosomal replication initiation ATPase DnaA
MQPNNNNIATILQLTSNNIATTLQLTQSEKAISSHITTAIFEAVQHTTGIDETTICSALRTEEVVNARQMVIALLHEVGISNHSRIGRELNKSHTGIYKSMQNHEAMLMINRAYRSTYRKILLIVQAHYENDSISDQ